MLCLFLLNVISAQFSFEQFAEGMVEIKENISQQKTDIVKKLFDANAQQLGEVEEEGRHLEKRLEQICIIELVAEELEQFAIGMDRDDTMEQKRHFLARNCQNLVALKKHLNLLSKEATHAVGDSGLRKLAEHCIAKTDQAIRIWTKANDGNGDDQQQKFSDEIVEMKIKIKMIELVEEVISGKFASDQFLELNGNGNQSQTPQKLLEHFGLANLVKEWHQMLADKFIRQIDQSIRPFLLKERQTKNEQQQGIVKSLLDSLNQIKTGQMPPENELHKQFNLALNNIEDKGDAKLGWESVTPYDIGTVSNWQLAMRAFLALSELLKNDTADENWRHYANSREKGNSSSGNKEKQHQKQQQNDQGRGNIFEQWLNDNLKLIKSVSDRIFPDEVLDQLRKKHRRRRRRIDLNAWLHCFSLMLLIIILIWLIIAFLVLISSGSSNRKGRRSRSRSSRTNNNNNRHSSYSGGSSNMFPDFTISDFDEDGRPIMTYWNSCHVAWYALRH